MKWETANTMPLKPLSIIIPAHNDAHHLPILLDSVEMFLRTNFTLQVIIIDNGSTDQYSNNSTDENLLYKKIDAKVFPSTARNIGANYAKNSVLAFLDADTEITSSWSENMQKLWHQLALQSPLITGAKCSIPSNPTTLEKYWFEPLARNESPKYINGCNIITNSHTFSMLSGFDERLETGEDVDICNRARTLSIPVLHDNSFQIIHHGYPKTISSFVRREVWHSTGDLMNLRLFLTSKVALASALFLGLHLAAILSIMLNRGAALACIFGILAICILASARAFSLSSLKQLSIGTAIYYLYFSGRAFGSMKAIYQKFRKKAEGLLN